MIDRSITMSYLCFPYTPVPTVEFCFGLMPVEQKANAIVRKVFKFPMKPSSIVYHCAIHNLPTFRYYKLYRIL